MNLILLSGGSGSRLWPLSNDVCSKQFLKLFKGADGINESMLQRMYHMIQEVDPSCSITIATSASQVDLIKEQLGEDVGISVEPSRRDTFPAIALATAYLHDAKGIGLDESVVVCPVDPWVEKGYFETLKLMSVAAGSSNLTLMGIEPTYPSEKYGYIIPDEGDSVREFKEKPTEDKAKEYISMGALWNGGVFAYKLGWLLEKAQELCGSSSYNELYDNYEKLPKISFDYAVVEHETDIKVIRYSGEWKDLGTWNTLTEAIDEEAIGNVVLGEDCQNVHVINKLGLKLIGLGLKDVVVVVTPEGILVADKKASSKIKEYL